MQRFAEKHLIVFFFEIKVKFHQSICFFVDIDKALQTYDSFSSRY